MTHTGWGQPFDGHWCAANEARATKALRDAGIWYGPKRPASFDAERLAIRHREMIDAVTKATAVRKYKAVKCEAARRRNIAFSTADHRRLVRWTLQERAKPKPLIRPGRNGLAQTIIELCAEAAEISMVEFFGPRRTRGTLIPARQVAAFLIKKRCGHLSFPAIGEKLGGRDHSTVIHGVKKVNEYLRGEGDPVIGAIALRIIAYVEPRLPL